MAAKTEKEDFILVHRIALEPNNKQRTLMAKSAGTARFAYNWALAEWKKQAQDQTDSKPHEAKLRQQLNSIKKEQFPWMYEVTKNAPQQAIKNLGKAFDRFFAKKAGYPKFKKKGEHDSFRADNGPLKKGLDAVNIEGKVIHLPRIGKVKMREPVRFKGQIKSAFVSLEADRWFVSISVSSTPTKKCHHPSQHLNLVKNHDCIGMDLGVHHLVTCSNGETYDAPKPLARYLKRLKRLQRALSRREKGKKNRAKLLKRLRRLHRRIANIRLDTLHKLTTSLTKRFSMLAIEDLHVKGMMRNSKLSRVMSDLGWGEFKRQLSYKSQRLGGQVYLAERFFPSSQFCHKCQYQNKDLTLRDRFWPCPSCGEWHDRDLNAANNLIDLALSCRVSACGEESSGYPGNWKVKLAFTKQEPSDELHE